MQVAIGDSMKYLGFILIACGMLIWILGAAAVKRRYLRRTGQEPLIFDRTQWATKDFSDAERLARRLYYIAALVCAGVGTAIIKHASG